MLCCPLKVSEILSLSRSEGPTRVSWGQRGSFHCGARGEPTQSQLTSCDSRNLPSCLEVPLSGTLLWLSAPHTDAPTSSLLPSWCSHLTFCSLSGKCTPFFTSSFTRTSLCHHTSSFQALLLTLWTFLFSTGWFSLAGGPSVPCRSLRGLRRGSSSVCSVRSLLFYWFWPLPSLFTQSMKHVAIHSYLKTGTEGLTNSFVEGGDEGGGAGSGRPWGTTWLPSRGHAHHLHWQVSGGLVSWAGQTPLFCRRVDLGTGWVGEPVLVALSAWGRPWCGLGTCALRTAILGFEASRREQAVHCSRAPPDRQRAPSKV